jgi:hypothetical protein
VSWRRKCRALRGTELVSEEGKGFSKSQGKELPKQFSLSHAVVRDVTIHVVTGH